MVLTRKSIGYISVLSALAATFDVSQSFGSERTFASLKIGETAYAWIEDLCSVPTGGEKEFTSVLKSNNKVRSEPPQGVPFMVVYGAKDGAFLMIHAPVGSTNPNDVILAHSRIHAGKDRGCVPDDGPIPVLFGLDGFSKFDEDLSVLDVPK